jgi:isopropylmalate/homocitrate/citramalate synthase
MDHDKLLQALEQCKRVKEKNYKVSLNVMCASYFTDSILDNLKNVISKNLEYLDFVYLADSYGGMEPKYVDYVFNSIKWLKTIKPSLKLGFHIHNNGQIGMANMIKSLDHVDIFDASFHGMGRGMGNVRLEDVVLFLKIKRDYDLNIEPFLNYLSLSNNEEMKDEIKNTILGFLNIHPYRIRDFKDETSLYNLYLKLNSLSFEKKYDYLI